MPGSQDRRRSRGRRRGRIQQYTCYSISFQGACIMLPPVLFRRPEGNAGGVLSCAPGEVPALGAAFSITARVRADGEQTSVLGDIISRFDQESRVGFSLGVHSQSIVSSQPNDRQLHFSVDGGGEGAWQDSGRPGTAATKQITGLASHGGFLYASTYEAQGDGRVYRKVSSAGPGGEWEDCGAPHHCNAVMSLAVFGGALYAGCGTYRASGSALALSENMAKGGVIYRYNDGAPGKQWECTGMLPAMRNPAADNPPDEEGRRRQDYVIRTLALSCSSAPLGRPLSRTRHTASVVSTGVTRLAPAALGRRSHRHGGGHGGIPRWAARFQTATHSPLDKNRISELIFPYVSIHFIFGSCQGLGMLTPRCACAGKLYAAPLYHRGVFSYDGSGPWKYEGDPGVRLFSLAAFEGHLYGAASVASFA
jgi:hypothetical protein